MNDRSYALPALAACVVAFGFPVFLVLDIAMASFSDWRSLASRPFNLGDLVFLALGGLMIVAFLGLRDWLRERLNFRALDLPLHLLIGLTAVFHGVMFALALATLVASADAVAMFGVVAWIGFVVLFGVVDLVIAIVLLRNRHELPGLLTLYAGVSLLLGVLELTVLFSAAALVLIPVQMAVLALTLFYRPDVLEVI